MRFKVQLVVCAEDGQEDTVHELTVLDKPCQRLEHLSTVRSKYTASSTHSVGASTSWRHPAKLWRGNCRAST